MLDLKNKNILKISFFIIIAGLVISLFYINSWVIDTLRENLEKKEKKIAYSYKFFIDEIYRNVLSTSEQSESDEKIDDKIISLFQEFVKDIDSPFILKDMKDGTLTSHPAELSKKTNINQIIQDMGSVFDPIPIKVDQLEFKLYYGDSSMVKLIRFIPLIEISIALLSIILISTIYFISKKNFQNKLYAGMSKETAHQLGTPISSLLGWSQYIKDKGLEGKVLEYIDEDIDRLKKISERFSKIGSKTKLSKFSLSALLDELVEYSKQRIPKTKKIKIHSIYASEIIINGDKILLLWAFENIIKNSIDAIKQNSGQIKINIKKNKKNKFIIDFTDTGIGISRMNWKKIFSPGFSSKPRGWGVGLSLSKRIIEDIHFGHIFVHNSTEGNTTIRVIL